MYYYTAMVPQAVIERDLGDMGECHQEARATCCAVNNNVLDPRVLLLSAPTKEQQVRLFLCK